MRRCTRAVRLLLILSVTLLAAAAQAEEPARQQQLVGAALVDFESVATGEGDAIRLQLRPDRVFGRVDLDLGRWLTVSAALARSNAFRADMPLWIAVAGHARWQQYGLALSYGLRLGRESGPLIWRGGEAFDPLVQEWSIRAGNVGARLQSALLWLRGRGRLGVHLGAAMGDTAFRAVLLLEGGWSQPVGPIALLGRAAVRVRELGGLDDVRVTTESRGAEADVGLGWRGLSLLAGVRYGAIDEAVSSDTPFWTVTLGWQTR